MSDHSTNFEMIFCIIEVQIHDKCPRLIIEFFSLLVDLTRCNNLMDYIFIHFRKNISIGRFHYLHAAIHSLNTTIVMLWIYLFKSPLVIN